VSEKLNVDPADRYLELVQPNRGAATGVDQEFLVAGLDQRARAEAAGLGIGTPVRSNVTRNSDAVMN
jgi:hypothetical protein